MEVHTYAERLDRLPFSGFHKKLLIVSGLGWMFDAMDILVVGAVLATISTSWGLDPQTAGLIGSANLAGMFLGAILAGSLADRFGRKGTFQATLLIYSVLNGLSAFAWNATSLIVIRFLTGIGLGGELPVAGTMVSEMAPARHRGFMLVILESFWAYGSVLAALIGFLVIPNFGWQAAFLIGAIPAFYVFVLRRALPESPRFLLSKGRVQEAEEVVRQIERESGVAAGAARPTVAGGANGGNASEEKLGFMALWGPTFIRRTVVLWVLWFAMQASYFGIFIWLPGLLRAKGFTLHDAFLLTLIISIAQIPGYFSAAYLVERWGRKATLVVYLLLCAVGAFFFGQQTLSAQADIGQILLWGSIIAFFNLGAWGVVYTYTPELYPTKIRGTGTGWAAAFGRIGGMIAPAMVGWILAAFGGNQAIVFTTFTAILLLGGFVVLVLGEETRGLTLEQIAG